MVRSALCRKEHPNVTSIQWHDVRVRRRVLHPDDWWPVVAANGGSHSPVARRSHHRAIVAGKAAARTIGERPVPLHRNAGRRLLGKLMSAGAMLGAVALLVSTSLPANAFFNPASVPRTSVTTGNVPTQELEVDAAAAAGAPIRDAYTVVSLVQKVAMMQPSGARGAAYTNDPNGTIQWPFPVTVPIASGFGPRQVAGCGFCSTFHEGVDFTPGAGVPIQAIADGVVSKVEFDSSGLGNNVTIDHVIKGQRVQSVYGHMMTGSVRVVVGQAVKVTDIVGRVGSTGASTGAHLHLEIHLDGTPIDPFVWLRANAN